MLTVEDCAHDRKTCKVATKKLVLRQAFRGLCLTNLKPMIVWNVPKRTPSVSRVPVLAAQGISRETNAPLAKPYTSAKTMIPACEGWKLNGSQSAKIDPPVTKEQAVITLK